MRQYFPFLNWGKNYKKQWLSGDLSAGLTVGVMLIPQGMAYSMLAGLPPIYGLYASTIPLIIYALFGTSRQLAVGPVAMVALLISSGVGAIAQQGSQEFISLAILLALMVGVIQFSMGLFRLGFLVNFLAHPVVAGFTSAAAIIIGLSQLKHLLGLSIPRGKVHETLIHVFQNIGHINYPTLILGLVGIFTLISIKKINRKIPGPLIVVLIGIIAVYFLDLTNIGVKIVKEVPEGLPSLMIPAISITSLKALLPTALAISFVGFMESIAVAKAIQAKHKDYNVVPNQELIGLGLANLFGSIFQAFPTTGGFSRTAVNDQAGAKTGLASIISAVLIIITLLLLTSYFYYLPKAILAAIIMVAVFGLIDFKEAKHLWHIDKKDFLLFMVTFIATLALSIETGIIIGVILSLALVVYHVSYPHIAILGKVPNTDIYRNIHRFDDVIQHPETLIFRFDAQLYFANLGSFERIINDHLEDDNAIKYIVINANSINSVDSSALHLLHDIITSLKVKQVQCYFTGMIGPVRDQFKKAGLIQLIGEDHFFLSEADAIKFIDGTESSIQKQYTLQNNGD